MWDILGSMGGIVTLGGVLLLGAMVVWGVARSSRKQTKGCVQRPDHCNHGCE